MSFARFCSWKSEQTRICNYIGHISDQNIAEQKINMESIPSGFGKEFVIGSEIKNNLPDESNNTRYYFIHFMDDIDHSCLCLRGMKQGILQINESGQLSILDNHFNPIKTNSSFIFENGILELYTNGWLNQRGLDQRSFCNIF